MAYMITRAKLKPVIRSTFTSKVASLKLVLKR